MKQSRTHNCGELRLSDAGKTVTLAGWMENVRAVSASLAFVVIRDFYGTTQLVIENEEMMNAIRAINKESTISVTGTVRERASKNPKLPTGEIEVVPEQISVTGRCRYNELPFEINRSREADEATRLKYRFLDLRNPAVKKNIILRCQVVAEIRKLMTEHGFLEITTPILTASSPEGARDYLVPARKHPGKFYALPQAPQQFKQLLMASGFDRYFQIAPCFRDEDARGDRTPGEFYQLDMEMSFATQDDVLGVLEEVLVPVFEKFGLYGDRVTPAPFRRIPFREAMEKYGTDKPDLRIDLVIQDATELMGSIGFGPFEGNVVKAVVVSGFEATRKQIDKLCADVEVQTATGSAWMKIPSSWAASPSSSSRSRNSSSKASACSPAASSASRQESSPSRRRPRACCARSSARSAPRTWTRSSTSSAGSSTSRCTRSARNPASSSSATTPSRCPRAGSRCWRRPSAARSTRSRSWPTSTTWSATAMRAPPAR